MKTFGGRAAEPRHVCVVLLSGLGDVVHGLPVLNALHDAIPGLRITWVVEPMPSTILKGHASIDRIVVYRAADGLGGIRKLASELASGDPIDVTLNFNVYTKSVWPTLLSRAPRRIGFDRARSFEGVWLAANDRLRSWPRAHTADMFLEFADHLGVAVPDPEWRIQFDESERREQREFFDRFGGKPIATIIPTSASYKKDWLPGRWATVADALEHDFGFRVLLAGGPGEREQAMAREIIQRSSAAIEWAMGDSVRRLAWTIGGSNLVVAPDTGPVHIARAIGVPVIGIYGHTNPWRVGPWKAYQDLWVDHYTEAGTPPDPSNRTPRWDRMQTIEAAEVLDRVHLAVNRYGAAVSRQPGLDSV